MKGPSVKQSMKHQVCSKLADFPPPSRPASDWQFQIFTVQAHLGRSTGRSTPQYWHLVVKNGNLLVELNWQIYPLVDLPVTGSFKFLLFKLIVADQLADPIPWVDLQVDRNGNFSGNFTFLLLELILADEVADLTPPHP